MALPQRKFRELVFQILYSWDFLVSDESDMIPLFMEHFQVPKRTVSLACSRAKEVRTHEKEADEKIQESSTSYDLKRISKVELNILRLGIYEIFFDPEIPAKVALSESIRLCRKFGTPESAQFVNALLDHLYQKDIASRDTEKLVLN